MDTKELTFTWEDEGNTRYLFMGTWPVAVAWVEKRNKHWSAYISLPGVSPKKQYAPLEDQLFDVNRRVREFYESACVWPEK